jgi:hypothetical protein
VGAVAQFGVAAADVVRVGAVVAVHAARTVALVG